MDQVNCIIVLRLRTEFCQAYNVPTHCQNKCNIKQRGTSNKYFANLSFLRFVREKRGCSPFITAYQNFNILWYLISLLWYTFLIPKSFFYSFTCFFRQCGKFVMALIFITQKFAYKLFQLRRHFEFEFHGNL